MNKLGRNMRNLENNSRPIMHSNISSIENLNENLDGRKSSNFFIMNEIFGTVIDSIKRDDVDFIKQFF